MRTLAALLVAFVALTGAAHAQTACPAPSGSNDTVISIGINSSSLSAQGVAPAASCIGLTAANAAALLAAFAQYCPPTVNSATTPPTVTPCTPSQVTAFIAQSVVSWVQSRGAQYQQTQAAAAVSAPTVTPLLPQ